MRSRLAAALGSFVFFWVAPATVAGLVPWWLTRWRVSRALPGVSLAPLLGGLLVFVGVAAVLECFWRFVFKGIGTPAPVAPTQHLVVTGLYSHVRNPMYLGVLFVILGQALLLVSTVLLEYAAAVWVVFCAVVVAYEEPTLGVQFGEEYARYRLAVPRWLPRLRPWRGGTE